MVLSILAGPEFVGGVVLPVLMVYVSYLVPVQHYGVEHVKTGKYFFELATVSW